ncbi:MAG: hypothetical protein K2K73_00220 [Ureaplasma sp.]|nr:hypothetical protein [Ureaplasma sp.]
MNRYLFIVSLLNLEQFKWGYGRKPKKDKVFNTKIMLPIDSFGKPNWKLIEEYIEIILQKEMSKIINLF